MQLAVCIPVLLSCLSTLVASHVIGGRQSSIPFGSLITKCTQPGVVALTFDDGPSVNTAMVLDKLKAAGQRATFFINGDNYEYIYDYNATVRRYIADGHQIGSHTWSHAHLPQLSNSGVALEMTRLEDALLNILGYFPYYMRFPYLDYSTSALAVMAQLQYHVMDCDINTKDWMYNTPETVATAAQLYTSGLAAGGTISLAHDPEPMTAPVLVDNMINAIISRGLRSVPVGECLGAPPAEWYRTTRGGSTSTSTKTSTTTTSSSTSSTPASSTSTPPASSTSTPPASSTSTPPASSTSTPPASSTSTPPASSTSTPTTPSTSTKSTSSTSQAATPTSKVSPDGTCGGTNGYTCPTPKCCSRYGFCGTTDEYCIGQNCQPAFGICNAPLPPGTTSPDGTCGGTIGYICPTGKCCSKSGWCGTTTAYCGTGCQPAFGICS